MCLPGPRASEPASDHESTIMTHRQRSRQSGKTLLKCHHENSNEGMMNDESGPLTSAIRPNA
jgi:hypothetical protein